MTIFRLGLIALITLCIAGPTHAAGDAKKPRSPEGGWPFAKIPAGLPDKESVQRGYQVYREVCAACHGMKLLSYRNLGEPGGPFYNDAYPNANDNPLVKAFAAEDEILDPIPNDSGEREYRPARPSDSFRSPYPNEQMARNANGGALPPDLSVIAKARGDGSEGAGASYIYSLLTGYPDPDTILFREGEDGLTVQYIPFDKGDTVGTLIQPTGLYYNPYMAGDATPQWDGDPRHVPYGGFIAMAPQLPDGRVTYVDGTEASTEQMAYDVAQFLHWASDPKQTQRKTLALPVMIYLVFLAALLWFSYRRIWRKVDH